MMMQVADATSAAASPKLGLLDRADLIGVKESRNTFGYKGRHEPT